MSRGEKGRSRGGERNRSRWGGGVNDYFWRLFGTNGD